LKIRNALDSLKTARLREICGERGLKVGGSASQLRSRLARSFRGDAEEAFGYFKRPELIDALSHVEFEIDGYRGEFVRLKQTRLKTLRKVAVAIFGDGWEPEDRRTVPVRGAKPVHIRWVEDDSAGGY
jgi:hypothetical protein